MGHPDNETITAYHGHGQNGEQENDQEHKQPQFLAFSGVRGELLRV